VKEAFEQLISGKRQNDMHTTACYIRLMQYIEETGENDIIELPALRAELLEQVKNSITHNTADWETLYICKPSQFFNTKDSIFYTENKDIAEYECEYIIKTQLDDGSWSIPWGWNNYSEEWSVSKNWGKANGIILNILYLQGLGKL